MYLFSLFGFFRKVEESSRPAGMRIDLRVAFVIAFRVLLGGAFQYNIPFLALGRGGVLVFAVFGFCVPRVFRGRDRGRFLVVIF